jgi:hypothetical protein
MFLRKMRYAIDRRCAAQEGIKAVHDDDLEDFLSSVGILHDILAGEARCKFCRQIVDLDSVQAVFPESGSVRLVCNREGCMNAFLRYSGGAK